MKPLPFLAAVLAMSAAGFVISGAFGVADAPVAESVRTATLSQPTIATTTVAVTPTINLALTAAAQNLEAARLNVAAANTQSAGQIQAAGIAATSQAASDHNNFIVAAMAATAQADQSKSAERLAKIGLAQAEADIDAVRVRQDGLLIIPQIMMSLATLVIGVALIAWLRVAVKAQLATNEPEQASDESARFIQTTPGNYHSGHVPTSVANFRAWADAMLAGEMAGENKWTTAESPFTSASYPPFLAWAESKGFIDDKPGVGKFLSAAGREYCSAWIKQQDML